jgi:uncharacterized membrane protein YfcA
MELSIGITAHRDLVAEEVPILEEQVRVFFRSLGEEFPDLNPSLITALAEGGDRLAARQALELGIPVTAVLPMAQQEYEKDFVAPGSLAEFRELLASSSRVIVLPLIKGLDADSLAFDQASRNRQYAQLGVFISNHCQVLLALWDGRKGKDLGGTGQVVQYHLTAVMPGFAAGESSADLLADNENDLAYHIVCSRDRPGGSPETGLVPLETYWITSTAGRESGEQFPADYHEILQRLQDYGGDVLKYESEISAEAESLLTDLPELALPGGAKEADRLYGIADWLAIHFQKRVNLALLITFMLAVVMGLVFLVYSEYLLPDHFVFIFLALFFLGVVFHVIGSRRQWHRKYLDYRALAEGLRVQIYWNLAGVVDSSSPGFAFDNFLQKQDVDLAWIRHVMRSASIQRDRGSEPDRRWVDWVIAQWIGDRAGAKGQLAYYSRKAQHNAVRNRRTELLGNISLWAGIAIAGLLAVAGGGLDGSMKHILMILMGVLPLMAGVRSAYSHQKAEKELIRQYRFMNRIFSNARRLLDESSDDEFQRRVLKAVGEAALEEGAEWILMHRERPLEHGRL